MWLVFALLSGGLFTIQGLMTRHVLRGDKDAWAFSFFFSAVGALVIFPFMMYQLKVPAVTSSLWWLMGGIGVLVVINNWLSFRAANLLEASLQGSLTKFRLVWTLLFGALFLQESMTVLKVAGTMLTIAAGLIIIRKFKHARASVLGIVYVVGATLAYAIVATASKPLLIPFNSASFTFFIFFFPAIINVIIMPRALSRILKLAKDHGMLVLVACAFGGFANLAMIQAFAMGEVSKVVVIVEAFLVVTLVGEHVFLKERSHLWTKAFAVVSATIGAILVRLG